MQFYFPLVDNGPKLISVKVTDMDTHIVQIETMNVEVYGAATDNIGELRCPLIAEPGQFFACALWSSSFRGNKVRFEITDQTTGLSTNTPYLKWPDSIEDRPQQDIGVNSDSDQTLDNPMIDEKAFVMPVTEFGEATDFLTGAEVWTGLQLGGLILDVVYPVCDYGLVWCPLVSACASSCDTHLGVASNSTRDYRGFSGKFLSMKSIANLTSIRGVKIDNSPDEGKEIGDRFDIKGKEDKKIKGQGSRIRNSDYFYLKNKIMNLKAFWKGKSMNYPFSFRKVLSRTIRSNDSQRKCYLVEKDLSNKIISLQDDEP